jgi:putative ABC transport system permease protein
MTPRSLLLRNLLYHWRANSAVFLGVVVGTTVLTGALLVGDSLRGSLRDLTLHRLGWLQRSLVTTRFFREKLASEIQQGDEVVCPVLLLQGTAVVKEKGAITGQARGVTVFGVDDRFWSRWQEKKGFTLAEGQAPPVWINSTLKRDLNLAEGAMLYLQLRKPSEIPREALLGKKESKDLIEELPLKVTRALDSNEGPNDFTLRPSLEAPRTAYVPLSVLQDNLGIAGKVNALLTDSNDPTLQKRLEEHLKLEDWGLVLRSPRTRPDAIMNRLDGRDKDGKLQPFEWRDQLPGAMLEAMGISGSAVIERQDLEKYYATVPQYLSLESEQLLMPSFVGDAAEEASQKVGLRAAPTLVYLADSIQVKGTDIPYSVVASLDPGLAPPLGPFLPPGKKKLADDEIVLVQWDGWPKGLKVGDAITLTYLPADEQHENIKKRSAKFTFAGFVPLEGVTGDPDLTPEFPGITDKSSLAQLDKPFPTYDPNRINIKRDDGYWKQHRTTPKAYITLAEGQRLWASRFGDLTSVRLAPREQGADLFSLGEKFRKELLTRLPLDKGGFVFDPVREKALASSQGGMNFSLLFIGFSCFLIAAALLLVGLLFRLNLDKRASEIGLLFAEGYRRRRVRWLLLGEASLLALLGTVAGTAVALLYSWWLVDFLAATWPGGTLKSFLSPHAQPLSLIIGAAASLGVSVLTIWWVVFVMSRLPGKVLLSGQTTTEREPGLPARPGISRWIVVLGVVGALVLLVCSAFIADHEMQAFSFFSSGSLLLTACLAGVWAWMGSTRGGSITGRGWLSVGLLGIRNSGRYRARSLLTAGLLASATFLIVAVESFRREAQVQEYDRNSPSGGFALLAESDLPLILDLNTEEGKADILEKLELQYQDQGLDNEEIKKKLEQARGLLNDPKFHVVSMRLRQGDDASCLNLYKPNSPRILGVPKELIERGGFRFAGTQKEVANPWELLEADTSPMPAFGEKNTVTWIFQTGVGGTIQVPDQEGKEQPLEIAGLLQDSVFQSSLLVSEENFLKLYPDQEGYQYFLIQIAPGKEGEVTRLLERSLVDWGFEVTRSQDKLASYLAVENTYLSTFQALGGLGLILGSLGLGVVLLRSIWERRAELALLRALGYRKLNLAWLVLAENGFLLIVGLLAGTLSAIASITPQLLTQAAHIPWLNLVKLLALVLAVGLSAALLAVGSTLRAPLLPALRQE